MNKCSCQGKGERPTRLCYYHLYAALSAFPRCEIGSPPTEVETLELADLSLQKQTRAATAAPLLHPETCLLDHQILPCSTEIKCHQLRKRSQSTPTVLLYYRSDDMASLEDCWISHFVAVYRCLCLLLIALVCGQLSIRMLVLCQPPQKSKYALGK